MMRAPATLLLLALAGCGAPAPNNIAPAPGDAAYEMAPPTAPAPAQAPSTMSDPGESGGPQNSFIVCPGNPRCPPEGSRPKDR
jgi:hypothetical protein